MWKIGHPVRSAVLKPHIGRLVLRSVTTGESLLLHVYTFAFLYLQAESVHRRLPNYYNLQAVPSQSALLFCRFLDLPIREFFIEGVLQSSQELLLNLSRCIRSQLGQSLVWSGRIDV